MVARVIGGITFLGVFTLNVMLFVEKDGNGLSLSALKAYAQTGGTDNEEEENPCPSGKGLGEIETTENGKPFREWNEAMQKWYECQKYDKIFVCKTSGTACGVCGENNPQVGCSPQ